MRIKLALAYSKKISVLVRLQHIKISIESFESKNLTTSTLTLKVLRA